jgi:hypothetical protein
MFAKALDETRHLRPAVSVAEARDVLWTHEFGELYQQLVIERKWSAKRYGRWIADALAAAPFAEARGKFHGAQLRLVREGRSSTAPNTSGSRISWALRRPAYSSYADCAEPAFAPEVASSFHQSAPATISRICPSVRSGCAVAACALIL